MWGPMSAGWGRDWGRYEGGLAGDGGDGMEGREDIEEEKEDDKDNESSLHGSLPTISSPNFPCDAEEEGTLSFLDAATFSSNEVFLEKDTGTRDVLTSSVFSPFMGTLFSSICLEAAVVMLSNFNLISLFNKP